MICLKTQVALVKVGKDVSSGCYLLASLANIKMAGTSPLHSFSKNEVKISRVQEPLSCPDDVI